jgi:hypothetical protein
LTDPNDSRLWQSASIGTFAQLLKGADTPANRQALITEQILDDGYITADISQTGTLVPNSWANSYAGCSGFSSNNNYDYTCSSGKNIFELANQLDQYWFQTSGTLGQTVWDLVRNENYPIFTRLGSRCSSSWYFHHCRSRTTSSRSYRVFSLLGSFSYWPLGIGNFSTNKFTLNFPSPGNIFDLPRNIFFPPPKIFLIFLDPSRQGLPPRLPPRQWRPKHFRRFHLRSPPP